MKRARITEEIFLLAFAGVVRRYGFNMRGSRRAICGRDGQCPITGVLQAALDSKIPIPAFAWTFAAKKLGLPRAAAWRIVQAADGKPSPIRRRMIWILRGAV